MRPCRVLLTLVAVVLVSPHVARAESKAEQSVVKVSAFTSYPDPLNPWRKAGSNQSVGSGVVIEGNRILTAAHVVLFATEIEVQPYRSSSTYRAKLLAIAPEVDLAVLEVDDPAFFQGRAALKISSRLPKTQEQVSIHGYPVTGTIQKTISGTVGQAEYRAMAIQSQVLMLEVDATVIPGFSGGPATMNGEITGIVTMAFEAQVGFFIAAPEISMFLKDIADGRYDGKPIVPYFAQGVANASLRGRLGLPIQVTGGLVIRTFPSHTGDILRPGDVVTKIDDERIDNVGRVWLEESNLFIDHTYLIPLRANNGVVEMTVFRDGKIQSLKVPTTPSRSVDFLLAPPLLGRSPSYFVWGPLVFAIAYQETSSVLLEQGFADENTRAAVVQLAITGSPLLNTLGLARIPGERTVFVVDRIPHPTMAGYGDPIFEVIETVNGEEITNLTHLVQVLRELQQNEAKFAEFGFASAFFGRFVLDRSKAEATTETTLDTLGIRRRCSADLMNVWEGKVKPQERVTSGQGGIGGPSGERGEAFRTNLPRSNFGRTGAKRTLWTATDFNLTLGPAHESQGVSSKWRTDSKRRLWSADAFQPGVRRVYEIQGALGKD